MPRLAAAAILWFGLWLPPFRSGLESGMALHMIVQIPLLAMAGVLIAPEVRRLEPRWLAEADWLGIPGIVLVLFSTSYWMLPLALDSAIGDWRMEVAKFLSLPLLVGLPLALSWRRMPVLGRLFVIANIISKVGALGGLYLAAPVRLCAYYRLDQQAEAGWALLLVAGTAIFGAFLAGFFDWSWGRPFGGGWDGHRPAGTAANAGPPLPTRGCQPVGRPRLGGYDLIEPLHSRFRNYPIAGHLRFLLKEVQPEIHPHLLESDVDGVPFRRTERSVAYQRAEPPVAATVIAALAPPRGVGARRTKGYTRDQKPKPSLTPRLVNPSFRLARPAFDACAR